MAATALAVAGCGGGGSSDETGDRDRTVAIERVAFAERQHVGEQRSLTMTVRNTGDEPIRDLVVVLRGFSRHTAQTPQRPLWLVDEPPAGSATSLADTYATGALAPGRRKTLRWRVTAVLAGTHDLSYAVSGARLADGGQARGKLRVQVSSEPPFSRVDPRTGAVVRE